MEYEKDKLLKEIENLQAENSKLREELNGCRQKLQENSVKLQESEISNKRKLEFICYLSHEFKTPLNAISGFSTLLRENGLSEETRLRYCENIQKASEHLYQILEYAIDMSGAEIGNIKIYPEEFNTADVINEVLCVMEEKLEQKKIKLKCDLPYIKIRADKRRFRQIIYNLVGNAYKFNPKYGKIAIKTRCEKDNFFFEIKDSGCGIDPRNRSEVFNFFSDIKNNYDRQGSGIGLSFCKKIINLHGGDIDFDSIPEKSTVFRFFLPINLSVADKTMV